MPQPRSSGGLEPAPQQAGLRGRAYRDQESHGRTKGYKGLEDVMQRILQQRGCFGLQRSELLLRDMCPSTI